MNEVQKVHEKLEAARQSLVLLQGEDRSEMTSDQRVQHDMALERASRDHSLLTTEYEEATAALMAKGRKL